MHTTRVKMKDGRQVAGYIWTWRPQEGYFELAAVEGEDDLAIVRLVDVESAVTKGQRVGINADGSAKTEDQDELARARSQGWDGT